MALPDGARERVCVQLEIHCERSRFRVFVDGEQLCHFQHRLTSLGAVDTMWIKGSIAVTKLA